MTSNKKHQLRPGLKGVNSGDRVICSGQGVYAGRHEDSDYFYHRIIGRERTISITAINSSQISGNRLVDMFSMRDILLIEGKNGIIEARLCFLDRNDKGYDVANQMLEKWGW